ncbi:dinuclear metal center YbgI/SA1388 family protein [Kushneria sinocarnis]|uniref:Dinuclear metal center YbgI/SA1388 family protein n=1 Tax=Kushneria sinocarnis TaxID=595502 RepID=A0A420WVE5_9GAMM|nr:Nif3-like dinuclear metal center hexameric protein [Kushneria sinocarnis]RKR02515.1 dinuclear metal center YbgI/SA1388 family protein [Kushneria sinocarnis]
MTAEVPLNDLISDMSRLLEPQRFRDFTVNGLQVAGRERVRRVMTGVTACQALLDEAVEWQADMVMVHHGYFWKNEPVEVVGMKKRRLATLLAHDISLVAWHLPLDAHVELGNNALLGQRMRWSIEGSLDAPMGQGLLFHGDTGEALTTESLTASLEQALARKPLVIEGHQRPIRRIAWCTGGAQDMIQTAADAGMDAFVSGEISERTTHLARELGITYAAAGHHATERDGVRALGEWLAGQHGLEHRFVEIDNPV